MKSSYTKRALAFWLAVAMVATSAPMAFATASTSPTSTISDTTVTAATQELTIQSATIAEKTYDGETAIPAEKITVTFTGATEAPVKDTDYTVTGVYNSADAGESVAATVTVTLTETGKTKYTLTKSTFETTGKITKANVNPITPAKQSVEVGTSKDAILAELKKTVVTGVKGQTVTGTFDLTDVKSTGALPAAMTVSSANVNDFTNTSGNYTITAKFTPTGQDAVNYNEKTDITFECDVTGQQAQTLSFAKAEVSVVFGSTPEENKATSTATTESGKITYSSSNEDVATVDADTGAVTVVGVGTATIKAHTDGSDKYLPADASYVLTVADSKQQLTSSQINFASKTVTADGKTYFKLDNASLNGVTDTNGKWTYAVKGVSTLSEQSEMPSFKDAGVYTIVASYQSNKYVGSQEATLTIKPAVKSTITVSASQLGSSYDDNYKYWDLDKRGSGDGYLNLRADADDYLVNQRINGTSSEWIGMTISPEVSGTAKASGLWVSTNQSTWHELKKNDTLSLSDFYISDIGEKTFDLWYDTDDRDCHDSLYLATDSNGSNKFEIYVDFDSYSGSSSSSSGSSSSNTSKKDGDRVSTTTVDKTPSVKNGSATVTFSSSALSDALDDNKKEAKREKADKTYIELDVKNSKSVDDTTITVPRSSLDKLADEDTGLKLTTNQGTVTFDDRALAEIYDACDKTNIEFYLEEEDDDQYVLLIKDGSSDVIDLGRGSVEVTFDYKLKSGEKSSDVKVYRIGNGDKTWLATYGGSTVYGAADVYAAAPAYVTDMKADYSSSKKKVTFTTDALGTFLITTDTLKTGSGSTTTTPTYNAFVDVPSSRWSATYINKLASLGIINGTGGGYFEPTLYVTREEFVKMLAGVAGANVTGYTSSRFPDVPLSRWSAPYIAWAADRGITTGTDGGNFAPAMRITREEMATMIYRYVQSAGKTLPAKNTPVIFADANLISGWAQTPVSVMQQAGIIDGNVTNGRYTFDPKVSASREECAKMLAVLYDLVR